MMQVNQHHASCGSNGKSAYNESAMRSRQRIPLCLAGFLFGWKVTPRRIQKSAACPLLRSMHHENRMKGFPLGLCPEPLQLSPAVIRGAFCRRNVAGLLST
jgi:hypothetical protein